MIGRMGKMMHPAACWVQRAGAGCIVQSAGCIVQSASCNAHQAMCQGAVFHVRVGKIVAARKGMAKRYQDLLAWQLADELQRRVYELVDNSTASSDFRFRDQIKGSASAAPTNIAEGFGYYRHPEFARHVRIAKSELSETRTIWGMESIVAIGVTLSPNRCGTWQNGRLPLQLDCSST
jgi:four helix bundle protein